MVDRPELTRWFDNTSPHRITVMHGKEAYSPLSSEWFDHTEPPEHCMKGEACLLYRAGSSEFGARPPRKLSCRPDSPSSKVVRGGSVWSNYPELTRNCPVGLIPLAAKWFEEVRCGRREYLPEDARPDSPSSQWFGAIRPHRTSSNHHCDEGGSRPTGQVRLSSRRFDHKWLRVY